MEDRYSQKKYKEINKKSALISVISVISVEKKEEKRNQGVETWVKQLKSIK